MLMLCVLQPTPGSGGGGGGGIESGISSPVPRRWSSLSPRAWLQAVTGRSSSGGASWRAKVRVALPAGGLATSSKVVVEVSAGSCPGRGGEGRGGEGSEV